MGRGCWIQVLLIRGNVWMVALRRGFSFCFFHQNLRKVFPGTARNCFCMSRNDEMQQASCESLSLFSFVEKDAFLSFWNLESEYKRYQNLIFVGKLKGRHR